MGSLEGIVKGEVSDEGGASPSPHSAGLASATPASTPGPGPLQPLVDTFGALLGAEVAAQFQPHPDWERLRHALFGFHPNGSPVPPDLSLPASALAALSSATASALSEEAPQTETEPPAASLSPPPTVRNARQEEPVEAALARLGLPDVEAQVKAGTPRYLAEQAITHRLQAIISIFLLLSPRVNLPSSRPT